MSKKQKSSLLSDIGTAPEGYYGGVDLSWVGTALVIIDQDGKVAERVHIGTPNELEEFYRVDIIAQHTIPVLARYSPIVTTIEGYSYGGPRVVKAAKLGELFRRDLWSLGMCYGDLAPSSLKLWATGHGHASKEAMIAKAREFWPECANDDEADAFLLAMYGRSTVAN